MRQLTLLLFLCWGAGIYFSCSKKEDPPANPCANISISIAGSVTNASPGQSNGAVNATASGSSSFTYRIGSGSYQSSGNFTGLAAGVYTVEAKDGNGCTKTQAFTIGTNNPCAGVTVTVSATVTNATTGQNNGSINATATGGSGFTYSINGTTFQASGQFTGLAAGTYTVTAKNSDGCTGTTQAVVGVNNPCAGVTVTVSATVVNATTGQSNGSITASATGGSGFTYSINGTTFQATGTFSNLAAATYTVTAKNSDGCTGTTQAVVGTTNPCAGVNISVNSATTAQIPCGGGQGSIVVTATGSSNFQYSLNGGVFQSSNTFAGLNAGNYNITARDNNNCNGTGSATVATANAGPMFTEVKNILINNCLSCHNNSNQQGGQNWQVDCNIVTAANSIKARAVDQAGTSSQMPQPPLPPLSAADRQKIVNWVQAGGKFSD